MMTEQENILRETMRMLAKWKNGVEMRESELQYLQKCLSNVSIEVTKTLRQLQLDKKR